MPNKRAREEEGSDAIGNTKARKQESSTQESSTTPRSTGKRAKKISCLDDDAWLFGDEHPAMQGESNPLPEKFYQIDKDYLTGIVHFLPMSKRPQGGYIHFKDPEKLTSKMFDARATYKKDMLLPYGYTVRKNDVSQEVKDHVKLEMHKKFHNIREPKFQSVEPHFSEKIRMAYRDLNYFEEREIDEIYQRTNCEIVKRTIMYKKTRDHDFFFKLWKLGHTAYMSKTETYKRTFYYQHKGIFKTSAESDRVLDQMGRFMHTSLADLNVHGNDEKLSGIGHLKCMEGKGNMARTKCWNQINGNCLRMSPYEQVYRYLPDCLIICESDSFMMKAYRDGILEHLGKKGLTGFLVTAGGMPDRQANLFCHHLVKERGIQAFVVTDDDISGCLIAFQYIFVGNGEVFAPDQAINNNAIVLAPNKNVRAAAQGPLRASDLVKVENLTNRVRAGKMNMPGWKAYQNKIGDNWKKITFPEIYYVGLRPLWMVISMIYKGNPKLYEIYHCFNWLANRDPKPGKKINLEPIFKPMREVVNILMAPPQVLKNFEDKLRMRTKQNYTIHLESYKDHHIWLVDQINDYMRPNQKPIVADKPKPEKKAPVPRIKTMKGKIRKKWFKHTVIPVIPST